MAGVCKRPFSSGLQLRPLAKRGDVRGEEEELVERADEEAAGPRGLGVVRAPRPACFCNDT